MSSYIPEHLVADIIHRVGDQEDFRLLGHFIAIGPAYKDLIYSKEVLSTVDLDEFFDNGEFVSVESMYRHFLLKRLNNGNPTAKYVESLRILTQVGPSQEALDMLGDAASHRIYGHYAYGLFLISCGAVEDGIELIESFLKRVTNLAEGVMTAEHIEGEIREMSLLGYHLFMNYFTPSQLAPVCMLYHPVEINIANIALP